MTVPSRARLLLLPLLVLASLAAGCGGDAETKTVTQVKTVETPAAEPGASDEAADDDAKPDAATDEATVNQVLTEATGEPYMVPGKYSPSAFSVDIWYDTRSGRDGVHFNSTTEGEAAANFTAGGTEDFFSLPASGSVTLQDGTKVSWKNVVKGASSDIEVTVGSTKVTGSQYGENLDDKTLDPGLTVPQVLELGKLLSERGIDHF